MSVLPGTLRGITKEGCGSNMSSNLSLYSRPNKVTHPSAQCLTQLNQHANNNWQNRCVFYILMISHIHILDYKTTPKSCKRDRKGVKQIGGSRKKASPLCALGPFTTSCSPWKWRLVYDHVAAEATNKTSTHHHCCFPAQITGAWGSNVRGQAYEKEK